MQSPGLISKNISILCSIQDTVLSICLLFRSAVLLWAIGHEACLETQRKSTAPFTGLRYLPPKNLVMSKSVNFLFFAERRFKPSLRRKISGKKHLCIVQLHRPLAMVIFTVDATLHDYFLSTQRDLSLRLIAQVRSSVEVLGRFVACHFASFCPWMIERQCNM